MEPREQNFSFNCLPSFITHPSIAPARQFQQQRLDSNLAAIKEECGTQWTTLLHLLPTLEKIVEILPMPLSMVLDSGSEKAFVIKPPLSAELLERGTHENVIILHDIRTSLSVSLYILYVYICLHVAVVSAC